MGPRRRHPRYDFGSRDHPRGQVCQIPDIINRQEREGTCHRVQERVVRVSRRSDSPERDQFRLRAWQDIRPRRSDRGRQDNDSVPHRPTL